MAFAIEGRHRSQLSPFLLPPILKDDLLCTVLRETNKCIKEGGGTVQSRLRAYMAVFYNGLQRFYSLLQVELLTNIHFTSVSAVFSCPKIVLLAFRHFFFSEH